MVYPIYVYGSPVLRKKTAEIPPDYPGLGQLIQDMFETMKSSDGVGLAAPQIGLAIRIFVADTSEVEPGEGRQEEDLSSFRKAFINPRITRLWGEKWIYNEGCLSVPTLREDVERPEHVRIEYFDENFNHHAEEYSGIKSRIIQHEYDHLEGIMFVDRINPLKKRLINGKLNSISRGKVDIDYKIKIPIK
jgi:peptide deformylase